MAGGRVGFTVWRLGVMRIMRLPVRSMVCTVCIAMMSGAIRHTDLIGTWHFWVRIFDTGEISHARGDIEILEHLVAARILARNGNRALRVGDVTEDE